MGKVIRIPKKLSIIEKVGISYKRPELTGQTTSYALYDDGWQFGNNKYKASTPPNPETIQELDDSDPYLRTLKYNNFFGNKFRFTDINGVESLDIQSIYVIDNLTGYGLWITASSFNVGTFNEWFGAGGLLENYNDANKAGYNDWFAANATIIEGLISYQKYIDSGNYWIVPYYRTIAQHVNTSTSRDVTYHYYLNSTIALFYKSKKAIDSKHAMLTRIHFK